MNDECEVCGGTEWSHCDDSFDHEFGTERIAPYLMCCGCDETRLMPEREF